MEKKEVKLISHEVASSDTFRISYAKFSEGNNKKDNIRWSLNSFFYPVEISKEDSYKLLSFIIDETRRQAKEGESVVDSLIKVDKLLPDFGFAKAPFGSFSRPNELFIVEGNKNSFTHSKDYKKYFDWYKENISSEEASDIFTKMNFKESYQVKKLMRK